MGTVVLLPQDCLRPQSQHRQQTTECTPRSMRNSLASAHAQGAGLLPLPGHGGHSLPMDIARRRGGGNPLKQRDINPRPKVVSNAPVYKILQRPKRGDAAVNVLAELVMPDEVLTRPVIGVAKNASTKGLRSGVDGTQEPNDHAKAEFGTSGTTSDGLGIKSGVSDIKVSKVCNDNGSLRQLKDVSNYLNGVHTSTVDGYKLPKMKMGASKPLSTSLDKVQSGPIDFARSFTPLKPSVRKAAGKDIFCMDQSARGRDRKGSMGLQRTSTEPQISKHMLGQYSSMMHTANDNLKSASHVENCGFSGNTISMSCQERWAGPAYISSPSPSSLPLPKLCLPHTRFFSLEIPPLVKQSSTSVYTQPFLRTPAPSENGGSWDAAFATKSLRKMLNLDPC